MSQRLSYTVIFPGQFFAQVSKNEHFNQKNIRSTEVLKLQNNFLLLPVLKATQINKIQRVPRSSSETLVTES